MKKKGFAPLYIIVAILILFIILAAIGAFLIFTRNSKNQTSSAQATPIIQKTGFGDMAATDNPSPDSSAGYKVEYCPKLPAKGEKTLTALESINKARAAGHTAILSVQPWFYRYDKNGQAIWSIVAKREDGKYVPFWITSENICERAIQEFDPSKPNILPINLQVDSPRVIEIAKNVTNENVDDPEKGRVVLNLEIPPDSQVPQWNVTFYPKGHSQDDTTITINAITGNIIKVDPQ